jgi:low affinity Fe/Cu permease
MKQFYLRIADSVDEFTATPAATVAAFVIVSFWALGGLRFGFGDSWQLVMDTVSSVTTFLMGFIIAGAQRRNTRALQLKLDLLIAANERTGNAAIAAESASTDVHAKVRQEIAKLAEVESPSR